MPKFVCGQAVRIARCEDFRQHLVGTETFVTEVRDMGPVVVYGLACAPIERVGRFGLWGWLCWFDEELEPIVPPDTAFGEDTHELYQPEAPVAETEGLP